MDAAYLAQADKVLSQLNWRQFAHQEDWAPDLRNFVFESLVINLDPVPGLSQPLLTTLTADFCRVVEQALHVEGESMEQKLDHISADIDMPALVATSKAGISRVATGKPGPPLSPSKKQKTLALTSGELGLPLAATSASSAAPAAAAITVGPSKYKDVRGTQAEQDARAELQEKARTLATEQSGPTMSARLLSNVQSALATTEQSGWPKDAPLVAV